MCFFVLFGRILTTSMAFRGFVLMTSFLALRASVCIFLWCLFNYFARFGLDGTATWMEQLPGLDTAARMEQLPGWNNYLGSNLRPQTTPPANFFVYYEIDDDESKHNLQLAEHGHQEVPNAWVLLEKA